MRTMKIRPGREPTSARAWGPDRIPAARDGQDASAEDASHAVAALYQLHYPALVRLAALLIPDLATAEDIVQDAFAAVHGRWRVLPDANAALAYLRWSVVHQSRSVPLPESADMAGDSGGQPPVRRRAARRRRDSRDPRRPFEMGPPAVSKVWRPR